MAKSEEYYSLLVLSDDHWVLGSGDYSKEIISTEREGPKYKGKTTVIVKSDSNEIAVDLFFMPQKELDIICNKMVQSQNERGNSVSL